MTEQAEGGITLKLRVAHSPELEGAVLRWAGDVEVITPGKLRDRMRISATRMRGCIGDARRSQAFLKPQMTQMAADGELGERGLRSRIGGAALPI